MKYLEAFKPGELLQLKVLLALMVLFIVAYSMMELIIGLLIFIIFALGFVISFIYVFKLRKQPHSQNLSLLEFNGIWVTTSVVGLFIFWCCGKLPGVDFDFDYWVVLLMILILPSFAFISLSIIECIMKRRTNIALFI